MAKYKIFVDGSSGTTGLRIADRLAARDEFEILHISEADRKDVNARAAVINQSDLSFLCLPDAAAREVVPLLRPDVRILDTSTAHRTAPDWVYGLPELHGKRDALRTANRVAVPGCYATGFITLVAPLVELGLLAADYPLTCHGLSGYSGAGKSGIAQYRDPERDIAFESPRPYGLTLDHKHLPEMQKICGLAEPPVFCPIAVSYTHLRAHEYAGRQGHLGNLPHCFPRRQADAAHQPAGQPWQRQLRCRRAVHEHHAGAGGNERAGIVS